MWRRSGTAGSMGGACAMPNDTIHMYEDGDKQNNGCTARRTRSVAMGPLRPWAGSGQLLTDVRVGKSPHLLVRRICEQ